MKKIFINVFSLLLIGSIITSCSSNEDVAGVDSSVKPTLTIDFPTAITVTEGTDIPVTFTVSKPVGVDFEIRVLINNQASTADLNDSDIENTSVNTSVEKVFTFPAFATTYTDVISIKNDDLAEPTETLAIYFDPTRVTAVSMTQLNSIITINNFVSNDLNLVFNWDQTFNVGGTDYTLCEIVYDLDFLVYNVTTTNISYIAATASCPEVGSMNLGDYPNGDYDILVNLYDDGGLSGAGVSPPFSIPITVDYIRSGSLTLSSGGSFVQDPAYALDSNTPSDPNGNDLRYLATVNVQNGVFTISDDNGTIASGRMANIKKAFKGLKINNKVRKNNISKL